jgi:phage N-6-adenine-methyltransferase
VSLFRHDHHEQDSSDEFATPSFFWQPIADAVDGFDLDPAAGANDEFRADVQYTKEDDGLAQDWFGKVWLNPPFSLKSEFLQKTIEEIVAGRVDLVVVLLPVDTSTDWFHDYVSQASAVFFLNGRLRFSGPGASNRDPNFGIMLAVFGECPEDLLDVLSANGMVFKQWQRYSPTEQTSLRDVEGDDA